jgi:hypothetical protein
MESIWTRTFWKHSAERAIKTAAQFPLALWSTVESAQALNWLDPFTMDWRVFASAALSGALFSVLTSLASSPLSEDDTPDLINDPPPA